LDDEEMSRLSSEAQTIISRETERRAEKMVAILQRGGKHPPADRTLVLAGSRLNLSDLSNMALRRALVGDGDDPAFVALDPDNPLTASPLALAEAAAEADTLVAADLFRADLGGMVGAHIQWITWVTNGRIVPANSSLPQDRLILAEPRWRNAALDAGWTAEQIEIAGWPRILPRQKVVGTQGMVAIVADVCAVEMPKRVQEFSSQLLLWELIEDELRRDPLSLGTDPDRYLDSRMKKMNIGAEGFDRRMFFEKLIEPAYKTGLARLMIESGIAVRVIGRGWEKFDEFKSCTFGAVESLAELERAVEGCRAVVQAFPMANPLTALGLREVHGHELARLKHSISGPIAPEIPDEAALNRKLVRLIPPSA
jgi:hypothetical protein